MLSNEIFVQIKFHQNQSIGLKADGMGEADRHTHMHGHDIVN
jgi:hypothetical protein